MDTFVLPVPVLLQLLHRLLNELTGRCFLTVGIRDAAGHRDWLAREVTVDRPSPPSHVFEVRLIEPPELPPPRLAVDDLPTSGLILFGTGRSRGHISVSSIDNDRPRPVSQLNLVGPGMHTVDLGSPSSRQPDTADRVPAIARDRWSRTIGALGGEHVWHRLVNLKMTIVGAGRSGSLIARSLIGMGVRDIRIIDPDIVERHNIGESEALDDRDIGFPKAVAVARHLRQLSSDREQLIEDLATSIWERRGIELAKQSDVIFSCVDRDGPRLAAALIAAAHHRLLIDIGTGILLDDSSRSPPGEPPRRRLGADVRVILPGEGCLLCRGGLTDYDGAVRELTTRETLAPADSSGGNSFGGRLGSLRSLNLLAAGAALRLLEGVVTGHGRGGWMHLEDDGGGRLDITYPSGQERSRTTERSPACALCLRAGLGDAVI